METYTIAGLKDLCRDSGLSVTGRKADLWQRLVHANIVSEPNRRKIAGLANPLAEIEQEAAANPDTFELQPTHLRKFLAYLGSDVEQWSDPDAYAIYSFVDSLPLSLNCDNDANSLLFIELLESYRDFETCIPTQDRGMVSANEFLDVARPLVGRNWISWSEDEVYAMFELHRGVSGVDCTREGSSPEAASVYQSVYENWTDLIMARPLLRKKLDPYFCAASFRGETPPPGYSTTLTGYLGAAHIDPLPAPLDTITAAAAAAGGGVGGGSAPVGYAYNFLTEDRVNHFIGYMQHAHPNLHFFKCRSYGNTVLV